MFKTPASSGLVPVVLLAAGAGCGGPEPPPAPPARVLYSEPQPFQIEVLSAATADGESFLGGTLTGRVNGTADWVLRVRVPTEALPEPVFGYKLHINIFDPKPTEAPPEFLPGVIMALKVFRLQEVAPDVFEAALTMPMPKKVGPGTVPVAVMVSLVDEGGEQWRSERTEIARLTLTDGAAAE